MKTLVYQRAHYPRKTGATGAAGEQDMSVAVGNEVARLAPVGWTVKLINADVPDAQYQGDAFVACHGDGSTNKALRGASVGYQTPEGDALAQAWKAAYGKVFPGPWKRDNYTVNLSKYYGVREAVGQGNRRAIIIEAGMMTNPAERAWIDKNHTAIAKSIWAAVAPESQLKKYRCTKSHGARPRPSVLSIPRLDCSFKEGQFYPYAVGKSGEFMKFYVKTKSGALVQAWGYARYFEEA